MGNCWPNKKNDLRTPTNNSKSKKQRHSSSINATTNCNKNGNDKVMGLDYKNNVLNKSNEKILNEMNGQVDDKQTAIMSCDLAIHQQLSHNEADIRNLHQVIANISDQNETTTQRKQSRTTTPNSTTTITTKLKHKFSFNRNNSNSTSGDKPVNINENKVKALFEKYKNEQDSILINGIQHICDDINIRPDDYKILIFSWKLNSKTMCKFTREEFHQGFKLNLKCDNLKDLKLKLEQIELDLKGNYEEFKSLYRWIYDFGLDSEAGERTLPLNIAISLWELVYAIHEPKILQKWLGFLRNCTNIKGITRDIWQIFPLFAETVGDFNFTTYDDNEAWPCLFDDFVQCELDEIEVNKKKDINNNSN